MSISLRIPTIFTAIDKMSSVVKKIGANVNGMANRMSVGVSKANRLFNRLTPSIGESRRKLLDLISTTSIFFALIGAAQFSYRAITDYETALHSLQAVTGEAYEKFQPQIESIAKKTNRSAIDIAGSFEIIGSAMSEYLNNPKALGMISDAGITFAKASRQEVEPALDQLTNILNQFSLGAEKAAFVVDKLSAGEIVGSVHSARLAEEMMDVGGVAYYSKIKLEEMTAAMEVLGKRIPHNQIGRLSRNMVVMMQSASKAPKPALKAFAKMGISTDVLMDKTKSYGERLKELSKATKNQEAMAMIFHKQDIAGATQLLNNIPLYEKWTKKIQETSAAQEQAAVNSDTLSQAVTAVKNQFVNYMVTGNKLNPTLEKLKSILFYLAKNMSEIIGWIITLVKWWLISKVVLLGLEAALFLYNVALGISQVRSATLAVSVGGGTVAMIAQTAASYAVIAAQWLWAGATKAMTGAQWLLNFAMDANPIGLIIIAIAALIAIVYVIIKYYDDWGASILLLLGPFGMLISVFVSVYKHWDKIKEAFKTGGIIAGFKMLGKVILDAVLMPVQQLLQLLSNIPGLTNIASKGVQGIADIRSGLNLDGGEGAAPLTVQKSPIVTSNQVNTNNNNNWLGIDINGNGNPFTTSQKGNGIPIPVRVSNTQGSR